MDVIIFYCLEMNDSVTIGEVGRKVRASLPAGGGFRMIASSAPRGVEVATTLGRVINKLEFESYDLLDFPACGAVTEAAAADLVHVNDDLRAVVVVTSRAFINAFGRAITKQVLGREGYPDTHKTHGVVYVATRYHAPNEWLGP
jgi:hypothetical protein